MSKKLSIRTSLTLLLATLFSSVSSASLTLDSTRYIFTGDQVSLSGIISNEGKNDMGAQIWIENLEVNNSKPSFIATPSFFKIEKDKEQVFRIIKVEENLPQDIESVYWLNLQEIPQLNKGSGISLAIRTKVKLIYRPKGLKEGRKGAESRMKIIYEPGRSWLVNSTPYIFAIGDIVDDNDKPIPFSEQDLDKLSMFLPGDKVEITGFNIKQLYALNDYGNLESVEMKN